MTSALDVALTRRYMGRLTDLRARITILATRAWDRLDSYDEADVARLADMLAPSTTAARLAAVDLTVGYLGQVAGPTVAVVIDDLPFDPAEAWRPPFISVWSAFKAGEPFEAAVASGRARAGGAGANIVTAAARSTATVVDVASPHIVGWRRVLSAEPCDWCKTVAGQEYRSAESASFGHDHCHCGFAPVTGDVDPGRLVNQPVLDAIPA